MWVQACQDDNFDSLTSTCSQVVWVYESGFLPALSLEDGLLISAGIVSLWGLAVSFKLFRKFLTR